MRLLFFTIYFRFHTKAKNANEKHSTDDRIQHRLRLFSSKIEMFPFFGWHLFCFIVHSIVFCISQFQKWQNRLRSNFKRTETFSKKCSAIALHVEQVFGYRSLVINGVFIYGCRKCDLIACVRLRYLYSSCECVCARFFRCNYKCAKVHKWNWSAKNGDMIGCKKKCVKENISLYWILYDK